MLSFPPFRVDLQSERVWKYDEELHLRRKPFAILRHLAKNPQRLVPHAEIVQAVWGKIAMSESLLRTHVRDLRHVLGEGVVETVPGRGYRFVADVKHIHADERADAGDLAPAESSGRTVVGRDSEVDALGAALHAVRDRRRAAVFITGEAGVGKTTLVDFFLQGSGANGPLCVGRGACVEQYGSGQAYLPVLDAIATLCRGRNADHAIDVMAKHAPTWLVQLPGLVPADLVEQLQRRAAGATQARILRELAEALEELSADAPVVIVFEDLQWTDPSTAELLAILGTRREPARLLVVGTYRPAEVTRGHPLTKVVGELMAHRQASTIALDGFGAETLGAYLSERFPGHRFPTNLASTLHRSTGGNPLFLATLLDDLEGQRVICERDGGWDLVTSVEDVAGRRPDGVRRLIDTQIDRLSAVEQRTLEAASVAGGSFSAGVVAHALEADPDGVDSCFESLAGDRGLLQYLGTETWPDGTIQSRYAFRHALFQHAALERSSSANTRAWHRRIAERLEAGYVQHEAEVAAELAVHFDRAKLPAKAAPHFATAGERAARRYGHLEAVAHFERALALLPSLPEGRERELVDMRASHGLGRCLLQLRGTEAAIPPLARAGELAARLQETARFAEVVVELQTCILVRGDLREATENAAALATLLEQVPDPALRSRATLIEAVAAMFRARFEETRRLFGVLGVRPGGKDNGHAAAADLPAPALAKAAFVAWLVGYPDTGLRLARLAHETAEASGDPFTRGMVLSDWARVHVWRREPAEAAKLARRAMALAGEGSFAVVTDMARAILEWARTELDPTSHVQPRDEGTKQRWDSIVMGRTIQAALFVARCVRLGHADRALEEIASALAIVERTDERIVEPELYRLRGEILKSRDPAEAERSIRTAIEIARQQSSLALELRATLSLHALASGAEKSRAREDVARLLSRFTEGLGTPDLVQARAVVESVDPTI